MNKTVKQAQNFMKKTQQSESSFQEAFEVHSPAAIPTIGIALTINLTEFEKQRIHNLLMDAHKADGLENGDVFHHIEELTKISQQIKSISAQSVLLHGERIKRAQVLLKNYRDGIFSKWLIETYGNRQTPYAMLRYYEFYQSVPKSTQSIIESSVPKKAIYLLASREGDLNKKIEIIQNKNSLKQNDLLQLIQDTFPTAETDKRTPKNTSILDALARECNKLEKRALSITEDEKRALYAIIKKLESFCSKKEIHIEGCSQNI